MKKDKSKFLSHYSTEIHRRKELPVNFEYAQFYSLHTEKEPADESVNAPTDEYFLGVEITEYQTTRFAIFSTLGKPISKMIR